MVQRKKKGGKKGTILNWKDFPRVLVIFMEDKWKHPFLTAKILLKLWFSEHEVCKHLAIIFSSLH